MIEPQYNLFLSVGAWMCALGAIFNLLKLKRRGNSALIMSAAFLTMGSLLWLVKTHADQRLVTASGVVLALLLVGDVVVRSRQRDDGR